MQKMSLSAIVHALIGATLVAAPTMGLAQTRPIQFSKVVIDPNAGKITQRVKVGTICLFSGEPLNFGTGERTLDSDRYERIFNETLKERKFTIVAKSADLFDNEGRGPQPEFLIGGKVRPTSVNICDSGSGQKGMIGISVEWKIFDRAKGEVVETIVTEGAGQLPKFTGDGVLLMLEGAYKESVNALAEKGVLQRYAGTPGS
jgi:hypothetical protein